MQELVPFLFLLGYQYTPYCVCMCVRERDTLCLFVVCGGEGEGAAGCLCAHAWLCFDDPSDGTVDVKYRVPSVFKCFLLRNDVQLEDFV